MESEVQMARDLIDRFGIEGHGNIWQPKMCDSFIQHFLKGKVTVSFCGVVLKMILRARPGHLGNFCRLLPCCARKRFRQSPIDLLPIKLPDDTLEEKALMKKLNAMFTRNEALPSDPQSIFDEAKLCGARPLGRVMPHPVDLTSEQKSTLSNLRRLVKIWLNDTTEEVSIKSWDMQSQDLGDMYTGQEIRKAYTLTWASIAPHVPGPGEAGRIDLAETVDPALKPYVVDLEMVRVPDDELREAPATAPVLVESDQE
eukprot:s447_g24.t1